MVKKLFGLILTAFIYLVPAQSNPNGKEIMHKSYEQSDGEDMKASLAMTLRNLLGDTRERSIRSVSENKS